MAGKQNIENILEKKFFELVPFNVALIDKEYNIIKANKNFEEYFGQWEDKRCFEVCKQQDKPCNHCRVMEVFATGEVKISDESGINRDGHPCHYVVHLAPLKNDDGEITHVIEMSTDVTGTNRWQRYYNILFERVPCYITIIDKNYRIIRANEMYRNTFGEAKGKYCYQVYKHKENRCANCPAALTFADGKEHFSTQIGFSKEGNKTRYIVHTAPLTRSEDGVELVIEIATDITELHELQEELRRAQDFYATVIKNSADGIIAVDNDENTKIFNPAAQEILDWKSPQFPTYNNLKQYLPESFFGESDSSGIIAGDNETYIQSSDGEDIPVRFNAVELKSRNELLGKVAFLQDLRDLYKLEKEKIDAERLGAVGQTVAGLAHTIKNLLMGLEGGIYIVDTGLKKGDAKRILDGWEVLQRNFDKTTSLVKDFLSFAKGRLPNLVPTDLNKLILDIIELYEETAKQQNVELIAELKEKLKPAPLDPNGIEASITNLISNAIDAATMREDNKGKVKIITKDNNENLIIEVVDNGVGMESEVIEKVFTTFFTTKGNKGTGLGLLTTNKIIKEHGGKIKVESKLGRGSTFRIILPRPRLEMIANESNHKERESHE